MIMNLKKMKLHKNWKRDWWKYIKTKRITLLCNPPIYRWLFWVYKPDKEEYRQIQYKTQGQRTFIYCPQCDFELISSNCHLLHYEPSESEYFYCSQCCTLSKWNFDLPVPCIEEVITDTHKKQEILSQHGYYENIFNEGDL